MSRKEAFVDFALALALVLLLGLLVSLGVAALPPPFTPPLIALVVIQGVIALAVVAGLLAWRRESWQALGLGRVRLRDLGRALATLLLVIGVALAVNVVLLQLVPEALDAHMQRLATLAALLTADVPIVVLVAAVLFIGFYEEVLARGLLLQRCRRFLGGTWAPVLVSSLLFGLAHLYQGWTGVVQTMVIGILFARLALHWGSLWPVILAHAALNGWSLAALRWMEGAALNGSSLAALRWMEGATLNGWSLAALRWMEG